MAELFLLDDAVWALRESTGIPLYDFDFNACFPCRQPWERPTTITAVSRCGAFDDYAARYSQLLNEGVRLVNTLEHHQRASELSAWFPLIEDLTPRSVVYEQRPSGRQIADEFDFPVFVKGSRQTSRHQKTLAIVESSADFDEAMQRYATDPILRWQPIVVRELVTLRRVEDVVADRVPSSFEFRTFCVA